MATGVSVKEGAGGSGQRRGRKDREKTGVEGKGKGGRNEE